MDYKERLAQFEAILSTKDLVNDPIIDLYKFRHLCFCGIPDKPGIRQKSWKILLGYLPTDKRKWQKTLSENRMVYYSFVRDLLAEPSEEELNEGFNSDHPLNPAPNSKWAEYFADNIILEQIDKDVCRTLPDFAFFQQPVPQSPLSPLSPRLQSESELNRLNEPQSPSLMEKLDSLRDVIALRSNDNEHQQLANGDGTSTRLEIASSKPSSIQTPINSLTSTSKVKLSSRPTPINTESVLSVNSIIPVRNRRSIFRRVQHLNKAFFRRENQPNSLSPTKISDDPCEDDNKIDLHWEAIERILFIYAKLNPGIGYVQGMNEILGPIYYTMANDGDEEGKAHAEADSFFVFTSLMADIRDHFVRSLDHDDITGIGATMTKMNRRLKAFSYELWEDLEHKSLHAPYYSFRWLTVMCAQEFALPDVIRVWDSVFADHDPDKGSSSGRFEFLIDFCCAMIICVKDELLQGAFEDNIKLLQHYPIQDPGVVLQKAYQLRESRLLAKLNGNEIYTSSETEYGPDGIIEDEEPRKGSSGRMWLNSNDDQYSYRRRSKFLPPTQNHLHRLLGSHQSPTPLLPVSPVPTNPFLALVRAILLR
ncbi:hypothetical protein G9A89_003375 [Geosiphon pyriformis]|nr:hypothetical protein G9A89_003375 [Geosiphon pyriformis]